jgi:DNA-binding MarR family transcriptional regulator
MPGSRSTVVPSRLQPHPASGDALARELLEVTLRLMRSVAAEMRRSHPQLEPGQMSMLFRLASGPATVTDLARFLSVSLPTVSKSIGVLEGRGWIERAVDSTCRRQTIVRLTTKGRRIMAGKHRKSELQVAAMLEPLTVPQREQVLATVQMLNRVLPRTP